MTNSVEAMPNGGHLTLKVATPQAAIVRLELADSGAGIPKELIERVTESYFTTKQRGLGLGLVLAKAIIENFGGTLAISSTPAVGTSVVIDLRPPDGCAGPDRRG